MDGGPILGGGNGGKGEQLVLGHVEMRIHCPVEIWASGLGLRGEIHARGRSHGKQQVIGIMEQKRLGGGRNPWKAPAFVTVVGHGGKVPNGDLAETLPSRLSAYAGMVTSHPGQEGAQGEESPGLGSPLTEGNRSP